GGGRRAEWRSRRSPAALARSGRIRGHGAVPAPDAGGGSAAAQDASMGVDPRPRELRAPGPGTLGGRSIGRPRSALSRRALLENRARRRRDFAGARGSRTRRPRGRSHRQTLLALRAPPVAGTASRALF